MVQALAPGDPGHVGKYRLVGRIGRGGMGQVFLGQSPGGRMVAVKLIRADLASDPDFRARFAREVTTARTVSGIFTVPVVDADVDGPQPWLVTAFVDGPSLADAVASRGPLPPGPALTLAAGLAEGLEVIHAVGVVHRDLKPSNVLLADDGPRIIDFGISHTSDASGLTRTGWVTGSPGFMSPEQAEGRPAGPASDIFSLGSVLAFAATGHEPFGAGTAPALLYRVVHGQPDTGALPPLIRPLVERCLAKDPQQRPTASQIVAELGPAPPEGGWLPRPLDDGRASHPGNTPSLAVPRREHAEIASPQPAFPSTVTTARSHDTGGRSSWPAQPPGPDRSRPGRRGQGLAWAAVAVAVAVLSIVAVAVMLHRPAAAHRVRSAAVSSAAPTSPATVTSSATTGWTTYRDPEGFAIKIPPSWAIHTRTATEVTFTGPQAGFVVLVGWTTHPKPDALADWRQQAALKTRSDPTYQQIGIQRVTYRGYNTADWEFTNMYHGQLTHVLDRGFIVTPGLLGYAIELYGPDTGWPAVRASIWEGLLQTFMSG
jgi:serine/threonine protein kinase